MNRPLPARDRVYRSGNPRGQSGSPRTVPGVIRLVGGAEAVASGVRATKKPPEPSPGGRKEIGRGRLGFERVGALPILSLGRFYAEAHLFAKRAANKPADAVRLPFGRCHQLLQGGSAGTLQQIQNLCGFAAHSRFFRLRSFGRGFRRFWRLSLEEWPSYPTFPWRAQRARDVR